MSWQPTETFLRGKVIKPFLPFEKHPNLTNDQLKNLYPGDEVYIFERKGSRWARGYALSKPFPNNFTITSVNLDELPGLETSIVVFPLSYISVVEEVAIEHVEVSKRYNNISDKDQMPTIKDAELNYKLAVDGNLYADDSQSLKPAPPAIPVHSLASKASHGLLGEIKYALVLLTSHIFALYSIGEFRLFNKLSGIYYSLYQARLKLLNGILTDNEAKVAKETATFLLDKIPKKLASRAARLNAVSYDLDNLNTDISGYKAILSRDTTSGDLLSNDNALPSRISLNQVLCALAANFPINAHSNLQQYSLDAPVNKLTKHEPPSHILVDFKSVSGSSAYQPPGFAGMIAYMYIRNSKKRLTEAFAVHTDSVDDLVHVEKISAALFRNIPASEVENGRVYLVAVLTEEIDLNIKESNNMPQIKRVKKGVAAGVTDITRIFSRNQGSLTSGEAHQFTIKLFGSYINQRKTTGKPESESAVNNGWGEAVDRIIAGSNHGIAVNPRAEKLVVSVKEFKHQFHGNSNFNPVGNNTPIARIKPIFYDPLAENYERIYLKIGKVSLLSSITKDDLLTFEVSTPNNDMIDFAKASNQQEKRSWQFVSVFPNESVGEIVKVNGVSLKSPNKKLPKDDYIILSLYVNGVLGGEGKLLYKSGNRLVEFNKKKSHTIEIISTYNLPMAQVEVSTEYIGKVYNSDVSIDNVFLYERFFKAGAKGVDELSASLVSFTKLDLSQLLKYFPELTTSLFTIVDHATRQPTTPGIDILLDNNFKAIVHLLDTLFGKQDQYMYLMNRFFAKYKRIPQMGPFLLNKAAEVFSRAEANWNSSSRSMCRVVLLLLKIAIVSVEGLSDIEQYKHALNTLFKSVAYFLSSQSPTLVSDQVLILDMVDYGLSLEEHLGHKAVLDIVVNLIDCVGTRGLGADEDALHNRKTTSSKDHRIIISKLLLINRLFLSALVEDPATRKTLISKSVVWSMEVLLGPLDFEASRLAATVLNAVCTTIWNSLSKQDQSDVDLSYSLCKLLPAIARTVIRYNKFARGNEYFKPKRTFTYLFQSEYPFQEHSLDSVVNDEVLVEILVELSTVFTFIAKIGKTTAGNEGYVEVLNTQIPDDFFDPSKYLAKNFQGEDIITLISGAKLIMRGKFFPEDKWLSLYAMLTEGCLTALELVRPLLLSHYIPPVDESEQFDRVIWGNYLKALLKIGTMAPVAVEHLSEVPKKACIQLTGTVRDRAAFLVNEAWDSLAWDAVEEDELRFNLTKFGGYQVEFISNDYAILQDLMLFALQKNAECQRVSVKILWSILVSEFILSDSIIDVERECLVGLHDIYNRNAYKPSPVEQEAFIDLLKATIRLDREDEAFSMFYNFIESLAGFLVVLNDLNSVPVGPEFEDDRTFHRLNINAYLKNANKPELFNSFINTMYEGHLSKGDYIQAALSLELYASTFSWDHNVILPPSFRPKFPQQTSFERKEMLYKMIATNYIKGNSLERATDTYNELLDSYNEHTYDLKSFAYVHNKLAKLYLDLESSDKLSPAFFRVAFIGAGFPTNIRGKEQIYEGLPFEHITSIHERLLRLYPGARIISDDAEASKLKEKVQTGRYLHVSTVEPVSEISEKLLNTSIGVRQYARNKDLRFFTTMKKIPGSTSIFDMWTEETTYETHLSFPTLMNRSDIKSTKVVKLSPLDNAIRTVINKNNDLVQLESIIGIAFKEKTEINSLLNDLSRQLAGTVDSPVNGGVGQYRTFFVDPSFQKEEYKDKIRLLKSTFSDLTMILNRCLILHGKLASPSLRNSHDALVELFKKNFKEEIEALKLNPDSDAASTTQSTHQSTYAPSLSLTLAEKRSLSSVNGASFQPPNGSRLTKTVSRASSSNSSASGLSGISSERASTTNNSSMSGFSFGRGKRTALNWRNMVNRGP